MKEKHPDFVEKLEEHGLTYTKIMSDEDLPSSFTGSGWKSAYMTNDKNVAEERFVYINFATLSCNTRTKIYNSLYLQGSEVGHKAGMDGK